MYLNPEKDLSASHVVIGNTHPMWRRIFTFGKTSPSTKLKKLSRLQSLSEFSLLMLTQLCLQYWQAKKNISNMWSGLLVFNNWGTSPERNGYVRSIIISWIICGNIFSVLLLRTNSWGFNHYIKVVRICFASSKQDSNSVSFALRISLILSTRSSTNLLAIKMSISFFWSLRVKGFIVSRTYLININVTNTEKRHRS